MPRSPLKKERWTITFDHDLKEQVQAEARRLRIYPVQLLESLVREKFNPYGLQSIRESVAYVNAVREQRKKMSGQRFLAEMRQWQKK